jgi:porin
MRLCRVVLASVSIALPITAAAQLTGPQLPYNSAAVGGLPQQATLTGNWNGSRDRLVAAGVQIGLQEQSEVWANLSGGLRRGAVYNGLTTGSISLDLETLAGWKGASFFIAGYQIHGRGPSANLVGNLQLVSNIEATRGTKLYDLWLEQRLFDGRLNIRLGQEGANDELMIAPYSAVLLNSSFGYPALPATVLPSGGPNYPLATPFVRVKYRATDEITLVSAAYNGDPAPPGPGDPQLRDKGGTAFRLSDPPLIFAELWYALNHSKESTGLRGTYKLGAWVHTGQFADQLFDNTGLPLGRQASTGIPRRHSPDYALYGIINQALWQQPGGQGGGIGAFFQVMGAPDDRNLSDLFIEGGVNWQAPFSGRDADVFALGVTYQGIGAAARRFKEMMVLPGASGSPLRSNETVLEATYFYQLTPWLSLQPDVQYVINPGAGLSNGVDGRRLKNSTIIGVRSQIVF